MNHITQEIDRIYDEIVEIRRDFHQHPELSEQEERTASKISQYLTSWGIPHQTGLAGFGICAMIQGKKTPASGGKFRTIGIRADMDALPIRERNEVPYCSQTEGVMHACGHDMHTAILLGTAKILKSMEQELPGTVKFFFQPAEETIGGADRMIQSGCMENPKVDAVLALHVAPTVPSGMVEFCLGKMNAASTELEIRIHGASCHGAHPNLGIDPILVGAYVITGLQSIVSRTLSPTNAGLVTIGQFHAGSKDNVIPNEAILTGIIRALDNDTREVLKQKAEQIACRTAEAFGATATVTLKDSYPALVNDPEVGAIIETMARRELSAGRICHMPEPSLGADDFSYFTNAAKGFYFNIGTKRPAEDRPQNLHNEWYNPDEYAMKTGMFMEAAGVLELLNYTTDNFKQENQCQTANGM